MSEPTILPGVSLKTLFTCSHCQKESAFLTLNTNQPGMRLCCWCYSEFIEANPQIFGEKHVENESVESTAD